MVNVAKVTGILDGLLEAGVRVDQKLLDTYRTWEQSNPFDLGSGWGKEPWSQKEMPLTDELVAEAAENSETAIVIIGRTAGEEQDNHLADGSYLLTADEHQMLRLTRQHFKRVIVLLNVGNLIDMQFVDDYRPDAVLYVWQGGMTGGTGTARVLTGEVSPSGKLPDTVAFRIEDYPSHPNFGGKNGNIYAEDIYVGYRYFETFAKDKVRYPFGFGLSYTTFHIKAEKVEHDTKKDQMYSPCHGRQHRKLPRQRGRAGLLRSAAGQARQAGARSDGVRENAHARARQEPDALAAACAARFLRRQRRDGIPLPQCARSG